MKRPFDFVTELSLKTLNKSKENFIYNFEQLDKILIWILGFSIGAISLIVSNIIDLKIIYCSSLIKQILFLLCISIVFGIVYRISSLLYLIKYQKIIFFLEEAFSLNEMMLVEKEKLNVKINIHEIHQKIKTGFNKDYSDIIDLYNKTENERQKSIYLDYLIDEYNRLVIWSKNEYNYSINYVKTTLGKAFGVSCYQIEKEFNRHDNPFFLKVWFFTSLVSLLLTILSFFIVMILIVVKY
ncbi:MAG: hypothetical protein ACK4IX_09810 [Candidatus Sericytochromatia bacterium]